MRRIMYGLRVRIYNWAKSTSKLGGKHLARERQNIPPQCHAGALLAVASQVAHEIRIFDMPYSDRFQEAVWKIWFNLDKIRSNKDPEALARTIAYRHLIDVYRKKRDFGEFPDSQLGPTNFAEQSSDGKLSALDANRTFLSWQSQDNLEGISLALHDALSQLPDREQTILRGFYGFNGEALPIAKLAKFVGLSPDYVKELKGAAIEKLKAILTTPYVAHTTALTIT